MNVAKQKQAKRLVINEDRIRTIEVSDVELSPRGELLPYSSFDVAPPPDDWPWKYGRR